MCPASRLSHGNETVASLVLLLIEPNGHNGPRLASRVMVDNITTAPQVQAWDTYRAAQRTGYRSPQPRLPGLKRSPQPKIDKSVLTIAEPKRIRCKEHLRYVASQPCLIYGR